MPTTRLKFLGLFACLLIFAAIIGSNGFVPIRTNAADQNTPKIRGLLKEKLKTLLKYADVTEERYQSGESNFKEFLDAQILVRCAHLDVCETDAERTTALVESLNKITKLEASVKALEAISRDAPGLLRVIAERLDIEIELERIKSK